MMLRLKKGEERRIRQGHPWVYSNEINTKITPLNTLKAGDQVIIEAHDKTVLGAALVNPHSLITARLFSYDPNETCDLSFFIRKIKEALFFRERLFDAPYYRLIFSESDGIPGLVIDRFLHDLVVQCNTYGMEKRIDLIASAIKQVLPHTHSILLRNDSSIRKYENLECYVKPLYGKPSDEILVNENGLTFYAPIITGQKTGWFYDHRLNRARLKSYIKHQSVLDVFSYLGGFAIVAAVFGAKRVDCIESSRVACDFITKNARHNNIEDKIHLICQDAFDAMKELLKSNQRYGLIILDPPAFVKKQKDRKEGIIAYLRLNELALKLLEPDGILITCSCSMHISMEDLTTIIQRAANHAQCVVQIIERGHQGQDHPIHPALPETDYLKTIFVRKIGEQTR